MATIITENMETNREESSRSDSSRSTLPAAGGPPFSGLVALTETVLKELVQLFKLLSDETRLRILHYLKQQKELNVRSLCKLLDQSQPSVSHHLALLRGAGLVEMRREGKHNYYRIIPRRFGELIDAVISAMPEVDGADPTKDRLIELRRAARF